MSDDIWSSTNQETAEVAKAPALEFTLDDTSNMRSTPIKITLLADVQMPLSKKNGIKRVLFPVDFNVWVHRLTNKLVTEAVNNDVPELKNRQFKFSFYKHSYSQEGCFRLSVTLHLHPDDDVALIQDLAGFRGRLCLLLRRSLVHAANDALADFTARPYDDYAKKRARENKRNRWEDLV